MLGVIRRFGVAQALRASGPPTLSARWAPQLCKWQSPAIRSPILNRSFQTSFPALNAAASNAVVETSEPSAPQLITKFMDLKDQELIDPMIIRNITHPTRMGLETMTEVQSQTINQMLQGDDM